MRVQQTVHLEMTRQEMGELLRPGIEALYPETTAKVRDVLVGKKTCLVMVQFRQRESPGLGHEDAPENEPAKGDRALARAIVDELLDAAGLTREELREAARRHKGPSEAEAKAILKPLANAFMPHSASQGNDAPTRSVATSPPA
jgi:hypothetical protein